MLMQVCTVGKNHFACELADTQNLASFRKKSQGTFNSSPQFCEKKFKWWHGYCNFKPTEQRRERERERKARQQVVHDYI